MLCGKLRFPSGFPETACNAVIRDLSRRILDGRRPRLGALLPQRLAGDSDFEFGFLRDVDTALVRNFARLESKTDVCPVAK